MSSCLNDFNQFEPNITVSAPEHMQRDDFVSPYVVLY